MSTTTSTSLNINVDCLTMILDIITQQMPDRRPISLNDSDPVRSRHTSRDPRPLNDLRAASQVCRQWRVLSLASPWLWGRVIDMDVEVRGPGRGEWMEEVVRRTGRSTPLWIYGVVTTTRIRGRTSSEFDTLSFFSRLLELSWERIEKLSVIIYGRSIPEVIQRRFLSRAPLLKVFEVELTEIRHGQELFREQDQQPELEVLFADDAPSLRTMNTDRICFKLYSPWLAGIREMVPMPFWLSIEDVFVVLQQTPMIRKIFLDRCSSPASYDPALVRRSHKLELPRLNSIALMTTLPEVVSVLSHLSPATELSVLIIRIIGLTTSRLFDRNPDIIPLLKENLCSYISNYFAANGPSHVQLKFTDRGFAFVDFSVMGDSGGSGREQQKFDVQILPDGVVFSMNVYDVDQTAALIFEAIEQAYFRSPGVFDSVKEITLDLSYVRHTRFSGIRSMLAVFRRLRSVRIHENGGQVLCAVCFPDLSGTGGPIPGGEGGGHSSNPAVLFPELHTVYLASLNFSNNGSSIVDFLVERKRVGYPVARLDMTTFRVPYDVPKDLKALGDVDGLEVVVWKKFEGPLGRAKVSRYVCGPGGLVEFD